MVINLFFFFLKVRAQVHISLSVSDSSEYLKQAIYFRSHFLYLKNGLNLIIPSLPSAQPYYFGTLYKLCSSILLPISSCRRCFIFISSSRKWEKCFLGVTLENNPTEQ